MTNLFYGSWHWDVFPIIHLQTLERPLVIALERLQHLVIVNPPVGVYVGAGAGAGRVRYVAHRL